MVEKINTCACCGQAIASPGRLTVRVDDALLQVCNHAYDQAGRRGALQVEIAHVVWCLASAEESRLWLERLGSSHSAIAEAADRWLASAERARSGMALRASEELKVLLARAEKIADRAMRGYASPQDFLVALAGHASDLASASFAAHIRRGAAPAPACRHHEGGRYAPVEPAAKTETAALLDRLARQDHDIAELRAVVARLLERGRTLAERGDDNGAHEMPEARGTGARGARRSSGLGWRARLKVRAAGLPRHRDERPAPLPPPPVIIPGVGTTIRRPARRDDGEDVPLPPRYRFVRALGPEPDAAGSAAADEDAEEEVDSTSDRMKRFYLSPDDDIQKAPSIGPKTAGRLIPAGIVLVRDLLACDPAEVAQRTAVRYITADRVADWKAQARLVCTIPWLRGTHAQLLVGAGYDTLGKLVRADASAVCAAVLRFAATREGQSILRSGPAPEIDRIACWIENTALAEPQRAA